MKYNYSGLTTLYSSGWSSGGFVIKIHHLVHAKGGLSIGEKLL